MTNFIISLFEMKNLPTSTHRRIIEKGSSASFDSIETWKPHLVVMSRSSIILLVSTLSTLAFVAGCITRLVLIKRSQNVNFVYVWESYPNSRSLKPLLSKIADKKNMIVKKKTTNKVAVTIEMTPENSYDNDYHKSKNSNFTMKSNKKRNEKTVRFPRFSSSINQDLFKKLKSSFHQIGPGSRSDVYYESLVHPGMFAHDDPCHIGVVGKNKGSILREVLKHITVNKVDIIGFEHFDFIDGRRNHSMNCFLGKCVHLHYGDASRWFEDNFGGYLASEKRIETFDVLILDKFEYFKKTKTSHIIGRFTQLLKIMNESLSDDGILIMTLNKLPPSTYTEDGKYSLIDYTSIIHILEKKLKFKRIHLYEAHDGHSGLTNVLVACKSEQCNQKWYANEAEVEYAVHGRIIQSTSGQHPLRYFDGATMKLFQIPHRVSEEAYCQKIPSPYECSIINDYGRTLKMPTLSFDIHNSSLGENAGRGVFAVVDVPQGAALGRELAHLAIHFPVKTNQIIVDYYENVSDDLYSVYTYMFGYGFEGEYMGGNDFLAFQEYFVDASIYTFINHGCNGTSNVGLVKEHLCVKKSNCELANENEVSVNRSRFHDLPIVNTPVYKRHRAKFHTGFDLTLRDIKAGEELFHNYLYFEQNENDFLAMANQVKSLCFGSDVGEVRSYEHKKSFEL